MNQNSHQQIALAYLAHIYVETSHSYFGGLLVTNQRGIPVEFRHTEAIKPSGLQQALYAEVLEQYLGSEVIGPTLVTNLQIRPNLLLIDLSGLPLYENLASLIDVPVAFLQSQSTKESEQNKVIGSKLSPLQMGRHLAGNYITPHEFNIKGQSNISGYAYSLDDTYATLTSSIIDSSSKLINLLSPFDRVRNALYSISNTVK